jgi:hypothetical protein
MTVIVSGLLIGGTHSNYDCTGSDTIISGNLATDFLLQPQPAPGQRSNIASLSGQQVCLCIRNYYLDFQNQTWALYEIPPFVANTAERFVSSGTFTIQPTAKVAGSGDVPSWLLSGAAAPSATAAPAGIPQGAFDISFDGHCDGMHLNQTGVRLGGGITGCGSTSVGGNSAIELSGIVPGTNTNDLGANIQSTINWYGCLTVYNLYWAEQTWASYESCDGSVEHLIDSGTFSYSAPPPAAIGLRRTSRE